MDSKTFLVLALVASTILPPVACKRNDEDSWLNGICAWEIVGAVAGVGAVVYGGPVLLGAAGFTAAGISPGSLAAGAMSLAAKTGVGGTVVGAAQSIGAIGLTKVGMLVGGTVGGTAGYKAGSMACDKQKRRDCD